jgi:predicted DNA-binding transcriptional regulator YafY
VLDEAISQGKKVRFCYAALDIHRQVYLRLDEQGWPKEYIVNPYQMAVSNGRYYLISNMEPHDNVVHFRLDRIRDIRLTEEPVKPMKQVRGLEQGLRLPEHMAEHIYMFSGETVRVRFLAEKAILDDVFDWFGMDIRLKELDDGTVSVSARVNERAMFCWAMQYGPHVEVLEPKGLREKLAKAAGEMAVKYKKEV